MGGGVGAYARQPNRIVELQPKAVKLRSLLDSGRVGMFGVDIGHTGQAIIFVVYGWTGGETNTKVAARTDDICSAILAEQLLYPGVPMCIAGDINCLPSSLPHLCQLLSPQCGWTDLGAIASFWGGTDHQGTWRAPNSDTYNRRDVMIVNAIFWGSFILSILNMICLMCMPL